MDARCTGRLDYCSHHNRHADNPDTINTGCTMLALALIVINLMAMAIYIPYLLDKERRYETDTTSKPIRTGHLHKAITSE
jgi:hypothetical protein